MRPARRARKESRRSRSVRGPEIRASDPPGLTIGMHRSGSADGTMPSLLASTFLFAVDRSALGWLAGSGGPRAPNCAHEQANAAARAGVCYQTLVGASISGAAAPDDTGGFP